MILIRLPINQKFKTLRMKNFTKIFILLTLVGLNINVNAQNHNVQSQIGSMLVFFLVLHLIAGVVILFFLILRRKGKKINEIGKEKYEELENNFDAEKVIGEMNYIIEVINEYYEQGECFRESYEIMKQSMGLGHLTNMISGQMMGGGSATKNIAKEAELYGVIKKELDSCIKKEWNPRIKILVKNCEKLFSDKELRNAYIHFVKADKEIQNLTIEAGRWNDFNKAFKFASIGLVAVTGLAVGATIAANRAADRQMVRDNLGI